MKKRSINPPYYVVETDNGFICFEIYQRHGSYGYALYTSPCVTINNSYYKNNYKDKKESWKACIRYYYHDQWAVVKRKSFDSIQRLVNNIENGKIKNKGRFPNPRIVKIESSIIELLKERDEYKLGGMNGLVKIE